MTTSSIGALPSCNNLKTTLVVDPLRLPLALMSADRAVDLISKKSLEELENEISRYGIEVKCSIPDVARD
jgi:hypothetical protein